MDCRRIQELIEEALDARLDGGRDPRDEGERAACRRHLAGCAPCRAEAGRRESLFAALEGPEPPPVPEGLAERVLPDAGGPPEVPVPRPWQWIGAAGLAAALAVLVVVAPPAATEAPTTSWSFQARALKGLSDWIGATVAAGEATRRDALVGAGSLALALDALLAARLLAARRRGRAGVDAPPRLWEAR